MMQTTLHRAARGRDVVVEQIRVAGLMLRREALVLAMVLTIVTIVIAVDIARDAAATWFDSDDWFPVALIAFLVPFAVWRREKRFGPAFLWTLPVDRRQIALARVFAGWVWLMTAVLALVVWQHVLAAIAGVANPRIASPSVFFGVTASYLLGSALVLGLRHPLRLLLGTFGVFFLLGYLNHTIGDGPDGRVDQFLSSTGFFTAIHAVVHAWRRLPAQWAINPILWIGAGLAALWFAVRRHGEHRRH